MKLKRILFLVPLIFLLFFPLVLFNMLYEKATSKKVLKGHRVKAMSPQLSGLKLNKRQQGLLALVVSQKELNMRKLSENYKNVSQRTLRRDMEKLANLGLIKRKGKTRNSIYFANS